MSDNDEFEKELKLGFLEEATSLLTEAETCFLTLESASDKGPSLEKIFRIAHNLKGSSKAVGLASMGAFTHEFESFLLKCKSGAIPIVPATISLLLKCNDHVQRTVEALKIDLSAELGHEELLAELASFDPTTHETPAESIQSIPAADDPAVEEPAAPNPPQAPLEIKVEPAAHAATPARTNADESIRVSLARLEKLLNFVGEMVILQTVLQEQASNAQSPLLRTTIHQMGKVTKEVQELSMSLRMVPLRQTFQKMQRVVRDTASQLGKKVEMILEGEDTEVDKTILESLGDPLVHLVRNAVDHGIEVPADRLAQNKADTGTIKLRAFHQSGRLVIEVSDDGGGISTEKLRQKALEKGILKAGQSIGEKEAINLIFHPGFSTKAVVTDVSGRGVGMDVVKTNIEKIQGEVIVDTQLGKGSNFRVNLPLTLAIIEGMIVRCGVDRFVIPLSHIQESVKPLPNDLQFTTNLGEVLLLRGTNLPVMRLARALGHKPIKGAEPAGIAVIIQPQSQGSPFAVLVDDIIGQQQIVIKKLGSELERSRGYGGSAVLGDGRPALILELAELASGFKNREAA